MSLNDDKQHVQADAIADDLGDRDIVRIAKRELRELENSTFRTVSVRMVRQDGQAELHVVIRAAYGLEYPKMIDSLRRRLMQRLGRRKIVAVHFFVKSLDIAK